MAQAPINRKSTSTQVDHLVISAGQNGISTTLNRYQQRNFRDRPAQRQAHQPAAHLLLSKPVHILQPSPLLSEHRQPAPHERRKPVAENAQPRETRRSHLLFLHAVSAQPADGFCGFVLNHPVEPAHLNGHRSPSPTRPTDYKYADAIATVKRHRNKETLGRNQLRSCVEHTLGEKLR